MKHLKLFTFLFAMVAFCATVAAQNGNVVVSDLRVYDMEDGSGMIVVHLSGNLAENYLGGTFSISGDRIPGGTASGGIGNNTRLPVEPLVPGNGNNNGSQTVYLAAVFPLAHSSGGGNQDDEVNLDLSFRHRWGNGLDYTYSARARMRRPTGI